MNNIFQSNHRTNRLLAWIHRKDSDGGCSFSLSRSAVTAAVGAAFGSMINKFFPESHTSWLAEYSSKLEAFVQCRKKSAILPTLPKLKVIFSRKYMLFIPLLHCCMKINLRLLRDFILALKYSNMYRILNTKLKRTRENKISSRQTR